MNGKMRKNIGFSLLPFSFIFLFEPSYALLDPLPDFIGYVIMCAALINLADINPSIMDAFKGFRRAAILSAVRFASLFVLTFAFEGQEQTITMLLLVFIFALFDAVILIPSYKSLFGGLLNLGIHHDSSAVYYCKKPGGMNASEKMYMLSCGMLIVKNALWALPEFTSLVGDDTYEFVGILRIFAMLIIVPVTVVWLVRMITYFVRVRRDETFVNNLMNVYNQKAEASPSFFDMRVLSVGIVALIVAFVFSLDLLFDNFNVTPDFIMYIALIVGALILRKHSKKWVLLTAFSSFGVISGALSFASRVYFYSRYLPSDVIRNIEAYDSYYFMFSCDVAEAVAFLACLASTIVVLKDVYYSSTDLVCDIGQTERRRMNVKFTAGAIVTSVFGAINAFATLFYVYSIPNVHKAEIFSMSNVLRMAFGIVFAFAFWYFAGYIKGCVKQHCKAYLY